MTPPRSAPREREPVVVAGTEDLAEQIRVGLAGAGPKKVPPRFLYDELGSALFEAITYLPEYGLTRADERILRDHAPGIVDAFPPPVVLAELGSGTGRKTRWILEELGRRQVTRYFPIDLSAAALERCRVDLSGVGRARVEPIEADYRSGLASVLERRRDERVLVLFLGSTIGNFEPEEAAAFLSDVRVTLEPGDGLLLGTDLLKPRDALRAAYDDPLGVTAAFCRNLLVRMNREMEADFDLARFRHEARWNEAERRMEMHLVALVTHEVTFRGPGLRVRFQAGESIWTESSYKYAPEDPARMGRRAGFTVAGQWTDREWPFAETLFVVAS